eukprot:CAMPEP_0180655722 /NCGR_PEP_ID=MMETSP1037_2-20121125/55439_1 /TAXON_ID=632150 /ORGANISM="Azadinium spinosum, Strain 3D9" /LENGTH=71 /DNA_ID=CAMNT_0022682195 /DNA_START=54 /DNA_END=269 /DNA_ORIENTATION=-
MKFMALWTPSIIFESLLPTSVRMRKFVARSWVLRMGGPNLATKSGSKFLRKSMSNATAAIVSPILIEVIGP